MLTAPDGLSVNVCESCYVMCELCALLLAKDTQTEKTKIFLLSTVLITDQSLC